MAIQKADWREAILDSVIELLAQKGMAGVTHRATDAAADLPQGSTTYYFPRKTALLRAAAERLAHRLEEECSALQINFADVVAKRGVEAAIEYVAGELTASADETRHLLLARIELTLAASRDAALGDVGRALSAAAQRPIEFFVSLISEGRSDVPVETCVGLIDGISLMYATGQGPQPTTRQVSSVLRALVSG